MMLSISSTGRISDDDHRERNVAHFSVLLRAPAYRHLFLADVEWLVPPALATRQFALADARHKESELAASVAVMLWASVAAEVDARLTAAASKPVRFRIPNQ